MAYKLNNIVKITINIVLYSLQNFRELPKNRAVRRGLLSSQSLLLLSNFTFCISTHIRNDNQKICNTSAFHSSKTLAITSLHNFFSFVSLKNSVFLLPLQNLVPPSIYSISLVSSVPLALNLPCEYHIFQSSPLSSARELEISTVSF